MVDACKGVVRLVAIERLLCQPLHNSLSYSHVPLEFTPTIQCHTSLLNRIQRFIIDYLISCVDYLDSRVWRIMSSTMSPIIPPRHTSNSTRSGYNSKEKALYLMPHHRSLSAVLCRVAHVSYLEFHLHRPLAGHCCCLAARSVHLLGPEHSTSVCPRDCVCLPR